MYVYACVCGCMCWCVCECVNMWVGSVCGCVWGVWGGVVTHNKFIDNFDIFDIQLSFIRVFIYKRPVPMYINDHIILFIGY